MKGNTKKKRLQGCQGLGFIIQKQLTSFLCLHFVLLYLQDSKQNVNRIEGFFSAIIASRVEAVRIFNRFGMERHGGGGAGGAGGAGITLRNYFVRFQIV